MNTYDKIVNKLDITKILSTPIEPLNEIPLIGKIEFLPLEQLTWAQFEALSLHVFENTYKKIPNHEFGDAYRYGVEGQAQQGLDIIIKNLNSKKYVVAECKHLTKITANTIRNIKKKFLSGAKFKDCERFILCTTYNLRDTKLVDELLSFEAEIKTYGIKLEQWGSRNLNEKLRSMFNTVEIFFGTEYALKFCNTPSLSMNIPIKFGARETLNIFSGWKISNNTSSITVFTPTEESHHLSCGIQFARHDLNGIELAINSKAFVELIQNRRHSLSIYQTTFISDYPEKDQFILTVTGARLILSKSEVDDLDWIISECWFKVLDSLKAMDQVWKATRFNRISNNTPTFALCRIETWFWNSIMSYCEAHDYSGAISDECIFDAAPNCLKVFVPHKTKDLDYGYHLIMYAHSDGGIFLRNDHVTLGWSPLKDIQGIPVESSPRKAWNAEFTHHWLLNDFLPKVMHWANTRYTNAKIYKYLYFFAKKPKIDFRPLNSYARSVAKYNPVGIGYRLATWEEAKTLTDLLQTHFSVHIQSTEISFFLVKQVLLSCILLIEKSQDVNWHYIKGNLGLHQEQKPKTAIYEIIRTDLPGRFANIGYLHHSLRCVYALIRDLPDIDSVTLNQLSDNLRPLWERYEEDTLFRTYA